MDATEHERTTRTRAIEGLRAIAQLEEYVAAEVDGPDDWTLLACDLRDSAGRHRRLALALAQPPPGELPRPRLRLVQ